MAVPKKFLEWGIYLYAKTIRKLEKYINKIKQKGEKVEPPFPFIDDHLYDD